ncbi:putative uDP-glucose 4-epimerase [Mycobacterium ulcerans str. Harvey]|uniref:UDP-glucose 4-epimerase n=1 Tax=Mycobacterium ulcerans str. Harvey TaxID=1299332 RepID=A0ABN0R924_MYCUL|nr:putative uDP-glucose 4-epimerase [Mycobacterium ulcerans str. Harvey]
MEAHQLVIDVVPGRGGGFSLEAPEGMRFLSRGRVFTGEEQALLEETPVITGAAYERGERRRCQVRWWPTTRRCVPPVGLAAVRS